MKRLGKKNILLLVGIILIFSISAIKIFLAFFPSFPKDNVIIPQNSEKSSSDAKFFYQPTKTKRISFEPNEFDAGILEDLLEQLQKYGKISMLIVEEVNKLKI